MPTKQPALNRPYRFDPVGFCVRIAERWLPDAFVIAILLSIVTFALATIIAGYSPHKTIEAWGDGFWSLLTFTNQIVLALLFGYALAHTRPMIRVMTFVASQARSATAAYLIVGFASLITAVFSWALCLVAGAILARRMAAACAERDIKVHYPLLVAMGFSGMVVWHQGLSSSIGLTIATEGHFLQDVIGIVPTSATIFALWNLFAVVVVVGTLPFVMRFLAPPDSEIRTFPAGEDADEGKSEPGHVSAAHPAEAMERSRLVSALVVAAGGYYLAIHFFLRQKGLDLNTLNLCFLVLGIAFAGTPERYARLVTDAARVCSPFLLQYPFYAGIAGMMASSGLAEMIVEMFVKIATPHSLPFFTFLSGGLLNIFIPSGGGQWAVQGPIAMAAAVEIGADVPKVAMAVAMGDQWTNMIQPFVALPALAVAGLKVRDIMGYCVIALVFTGVVYSAVLLLS